MGGTAQCRGHVKITLIGFFGLGPNRLMEELGMPDYLPHNIAMTKLDDEVQPLV